MKKIFSILMVCFMALTLSAQRAAVMEFKAGVGVSQTDVDGLCGMFTTGFRPAGYTIIERSQIDRIISEQNMQRSKLTESQMVRIGQLLNLSCIVIGDVNVAMGEYNVDVRVINVESGVVVATAGKAFTGSYGENMRGLAQTLAGKIAIKPVSSVSSAPDTTAKPTPTSTAIKPVVPSSSDPTTLYGYLTVFPSDLGAFDSRPFSIIANINKSKQYGYGTWRLPTSDELSLLRANNLIGNETYISSDGSSQGIVRLVTDKAKGEVLPYAPIGYVNLGLPSGTYWKENDEQGTYRQRDAIAKFGHDKLPSKEQWEELKNKCKWSWTGKGYNIEGPNGYSIFLPAESGGNSYSCSTYSSKVMTSGDRFDWHIYFNENEISIKEWYDCNKRAVRLVQ